MYIKSTHVRYLHYHDVMAQHANGEIHETK